MDELVLAHGLKEEDNIMAVGALDDEEEWLRALPDDQDKPIRLDTSGSMEVEMEYKEEDGMKTDNANKGQDIMDWLLAEQRDIVVEDEVIAMVMGEMMNTQAGILEESVVGVERQIVYPHHYGSVHTLLFRPATITKMCVELCCVIGLHAAGGSDVHVQPVQEDAKPQLEQDGSGEESDHLSNIIDWSRVGGVCMNSRLGWWRS